MPLEREVLPYRSEAGEKLLCAFRVAKAAHAALAFPGPLVAVLRPVVQPGGRLDEHCLKAVEAVIGEYRLFSLTR